MIIFGHRSFVVIRCKITEFNDNQATLAQWDRLPYKVSHSSSSVRSFDTVAGFSKKSLLIGVNKYGSQSHTAKR